MLKEFFILISIVLVLASFVIVHYLVNNTIKSKDILASIVKVTNFSTPSLSTTYYEPRVLFYDNAVNPAYPQMYTIDKMDLIYAK